MNRENTKPIFFLSVCLLFFISCRKDTTFRVLQFNVWQEGTMVKGGFDAMVDEIIFSEADFITLSEVRNYNDTRFCDRIVDALKKKGKTFYSFYSDDSGVLSRYPLLDSATVYPLKNDAGSIYKLVADMDGQEIAVYTAHLDYRDCASYLPRGYDGSTWAKLDKPVVDLDSVLYSNRASLRDDAIKQFIAEAEKDRGAGRLVVLGGDFNEPSHLDWTEETKDLFDHRGLVVPWDVSVLLQDAGYVDAYRSYFPDPVTHPGFTFPAACRDVALERLVWSPDADDRERIDFIYYFPHEGLWLEEVHIIGPAGDVKKGEMVVEQTEDPIVEPLIVWPTDHKALLATFRFGR